MIAAAGWPASGQSNQAALSAPAHDATTLAHSENPGPPPTSFQNAGAQAPATGRIRKACVQGRRRICGRVLRILPEGLVVDSGYPGLLRPQLDRSWVVRSNVAVSRPSNLLEQNVPGSLCVGLVLITDIPKKPAVRAYDYVVLQGYPCGQFNYTSLGTIHKTVRKFSTSLDKAILVKLQADNHDPAQTTNTGLKVSARMQLKP
jgi:hypothetical protein